MIRLLLVVVAAALLHGCDNSSSTPHEHEHEHGAAKSAEPSRGPHGGRLLQDGDFAVELTIFEQGTAPEFRVYASRAGQPIAPAEVGLGIELKRLGGATQQYRFAARGDYLVGDAEVAEPHSFDVTVTAQYQGRSHRWTFPSYEARTEIAAAMAQVNGIATAPIGPGVIKQTVVLYGAIQPDATRVRAVTARFPGVIRRVDVAVGERVSAGQTLALVESNESLQTYAVTAPIAGTVVRRRANAGEAAGSEALFELADYSRVWAVLNVFPRDRARLRPGQPVTVRAADGAAAGSGSIDTIGSLAAEGGQQLLHARVTLDNGDAQWTPGQFVNAETVVAETAVAMAVPLSALQTFRDWDVVFLQHGDSYQGMPVELGARDGDNVEIKSGVAPGVRVVTANAYLVKADIEKSGASHDH
jgi:membrane fusion protein, heavy metal efflux system